MPPSVTVLDAHNICCCIIMNELKLFKTLKSIQSHCMMINGLINIASCL